MLFSPEELRNLKFLESYANLIDDAYAILTPYYLDESKTKDFSPDVKLLFQELTNQISYIDNGLTYIEGDKEYLIKVLQEYSQELRRLLTSSITVNELLEGLVKNIYLLFMSFYADPANSSFNIRSPILAKNENFSRLLGLLQGTLNTLQNKEENNIDFMSSKILKLEEQVFKLNASLRFSDDKIDKSIESFLKPKKENFNKEAESLLETLKGNISNFNDSIENQIPNELNNLKEKIGDKLAQLEELGIEINSSKELLAEKTENDFSGFYIKKAREEKTLYYVMTVMSLLIIFISLRLAWLSLKKYYKNYVDPFGLKQTLAGLSVNQIEWAHKTAFLYLSLRLIISILLFLTVIYTGRIAYRSYLHWRHSENTHLKLSSFRPFISDLPREDKIQIRKNLIPDFFGKEAGNIDCNNESFKDLPTNVSALAAKAIEQVGNNINTKSNTGKNGNKPEGETQ